MNIERIQKLNKMALELKEQNIGYSQEEAIRTASRLYGEENNFSGEDISYHNNELKKEVRRLTFALKNALNIINDLQNKVNKHDKEINDIRVNNPSRDYTRREKEVSSNAPIKKVESSEQSQLDTSKKEEHNHKKALKKDIDRNGFSQNEISISKYFYCGQG